MSNQWYYAKAGKKEGPVALDDLKRLVEQGQLQPTDHVWKQGMPAWVPASSVDGLLAVVPPPPPVPQVDSASPAWTVTKKVLYWIRCHPIITLAIGCGVSFLPAMALPVSSGIQGFFAFLFMACFVAICVFWIIWAMKRKKRELLHGLWEPVVGEGIYIQFTKEGALVRGDGMACRYRWISNDKLELYEDEKSPKVQVVVLSLSKSELIVNVDGQGGHFKKGMTVTEAEAEAARQAAWSTAGAIAKGAGMLAFGGLAVLGGALSNTMTGDMGWCPACGCKYSLMDKVGDKVCRNCRAKLP